MKQFKTEMLWSIYFSLMTLIWMVLENVSGLHGKFIDYHLYLTNIYAIPAIWMMVLGLKAKRDRDYGGSVTYLRGLLSGIILSVFIALWSPLVQFVISYVISPEYFPNVIKRSVELGYYSSKAEAEAQFNYANYAKQSAMAALFMGIFTSTIVMLFLKRKGLKDNLS